MKNEKVPTGPPISRKTPTPSPSNANVALPPRFVRPITPTEQPNVNALPTSSITSTPAKNSRNTYVTKERFFNGKANMTEQLRLAIINSGPEYKYSSMKLMPFGDHALTPASHLMHNVRREFEFGVSMQERNNLLGVIRFDISKGTTTRKYVGEEFTNPDAIAAVRKQALNWSKVQGNDIKSISRDDDGVREFLRKLILEIPAQHRQTALAMIDQPPGYHQPLPGTKAERSAARAAAAAAEAAEAAAAAARLAGPNPTQPAIQTQQVVGAPEASASSDPAALSVPSNTGKRSYSAIDSDLTLHDSQLQPFKRAAPAYENQSLATAHAQPSSSWSASNGMSRPTLQQQQQQQIAPSFDLMSSTYDPYMFLGELLDRGQSHSQPQSQPSSSWSASNGMSQLGIQQQQPQQQQPQVPHIYNSGNMNYQTNVFQGGQYFGQSQFQPMPGTQNVSNSLPQTFQSSQRYQPSQTYQFNSSNATQGTNTNGPLPVAQPYNFYGTSAQASPVVTHDAEWAQLLKTIDYMAPIAPATHTQLTPLLPMTPANRQSVAESTTATLAQRPGTIG